MMVRMKLLLIFQHNGAANSRYQLVIGGQANSEKPEPKLYRPLKLSPFTQAQTFFVESKKVH
jgi:hypothetical protein